MIHMIAGLLLSVACVTLARNAFVVMEQGNRGSAIAHFAVAGACAFGAARAWWRWRKDTARRLAKKARPIAPVVPTTPASVEKKPAPRKSASPRKRRAKKR